MLLIVKIDINAKRGGLVTGSEIYGPDVQGAKKATITSRDGQSFEGQLDGRAFTVRDRQMVFADGQPAPNITVEPNLRTTIDTLLAESAKLLAVFRLPRRQAFRPTSKLVAGSHPPDGLGIPRGPGPACDQCEQGCNDTYYSEAGPTSSVGAFFCFISIACSALAFAKWVGCLALCHLPGHPCLPNPCGTFTTCDPADTCFSYEGGGLAARLPASFVRASVAGRT